MKIPKLKSPFYITLFLTTKCNQYCNFCYLDCKSDGKNLSLKNAKTILERCADADIFGINLSGGEPTLNPHFDEILKYSKEFDFFVGITTNGQFDEKIRNIIEKYVDGCSISIHGFKNTHNKLTNKKDSYQTALKNIKEFQTAIPVQISFTLTKKNIGELYPFCKSILEDYDVYGIGFNRLIPIGRGKNVDQLSIEDYQHAFSQIYKLKQEYKNKIIELADAFPLCLAEERYRELIRGCDAGFTYCAIDVEGNVKVCPASDIVIDNLLTKSFEEIWTNSEKLDATRNLEWVPESCSQCSVLSECMCGCRASYNNVHDILLIQEKPKPISKISIKKSTFRKKYLPEGRPKIKSNVKIREDIPGYILYHPKTSVLVLNETAKEILDLCDGTKNIEEISNYLSKKYDINKEYVEKDVQAFLKKLEPFLEYV